MFNQLMSAVQRLSPGDKMVMQFQRMKPTWLSAQGQGAGNSQKQEPTFMEGQGTEPPPGPAPYAAAPPAPVSSPDETAQRQMLLARMQQMSGQ